MWSESASCTERGGAGFFQATQGTLICKNLQNFVSFLTFGKHILPGTVKQDLNKLASWVF